MARPTVVVTRPAEQAAPWVAALQAHGWPALALPLLRIEPLLRPGSAPPWQAGGGWDAVMVVSPAAVDVMRAAGWGPPPPPVRLWAPGEGTARALRAWGVPAPRIDCAPAEAERIDAEALWSVVAPQVRAGFALLVVRGDSEGAGQGREWLLQQVRAGAGRAEAVSVYRRRAASWDAHQQQLARQAAAGGVWLLSSSEAAAYLPRVLPEGAWGQATALATHPRIAAVAQTLGFGRVLTTRPALADVLQALESMA
ncbi:MAG: uroporphyrinogen-III synthase [Tepidimonas sp.]|uniref:uroporphyrinogen-III synthase n=1 Tax=Tepidimonas sp. TaxID=2002775 RepID=UPI00298F11C8|nr:uroporphyrinogen-III synthase [Tepidimonas sp.]MCS6810424.1 uroporphyrinogen-III synthase [Tepidimonas sp.]MDW8336603.1 uroporphyrinogen-III synthase [Tepidimonas sp.]